MAGQSATPFDDVFADVPAPGGAPAPAGAAPGAFDAAFDEKGQHAPEPAWYDHLLAGLSHRLGSIREQEARLGGQFADPTPNADGTLPTFSARHAEATARAGADLARQDAAAKAAGAGEGTLGSILYGVGETPESLLAPGAAGIRGAVAAGAGLGGYSALANDRDVGEGAALGAIGGGVGSVLGKVGGKLVNSIRNQWADPEAQAIDKLATAGGVNLSVGDLAPGGQFAWAENKARWLPGSGVAATRQGQAQGIGDWAGRIESDIGAPIASQLGSMAPEEIVAKSARDREAAARANVRSLFAQVPGDVEIPTTEFAPKIRAILDANNGEYPAALTAGANTAPRSVIDKLQAIANPKTMSLTADDQDLLNGAFGGADRMSARQWQHAEQLSPGIMARAGGAPMPEEPISAMDAHWIASHLGDISRTLEGQGANRHLMSMVDEARGALLRDMDNVDDQTVGDAFRNARGAFKRDVVPFMEDPLLRSLVMPNARGEQLFSKLGPDRFATADTLASNLTPEGLTALQYGLFQRAANKGVNENLASGVSTQQLLKGLGNLGEEVGNNRAATRIFSPEQQSQIGDLADVVRSARGASTWAHEPPTGVQNQWLNLLHAVTGLAVGSGHMGTAVAAMAPFALARGVNTLSNNPAFKRLAMASGDNALSPTIQAILAASLSGEADPRDSGIAPDLLARLPGP